MVDRNPNLARLAGAYLFPQIHAHKAELLKKKPDAHIINMGIGDTTEPLPPAVVKGLSDSAANLGKKETYLGYGPAQGMEALRRKIAEVVYRNKVSSEEVFISDGAKCDIARLQTLFGPDAIIAAQDPAYPVYVDASVIMGQTRDIDPKTGQYDGFIYLPCTAENNFWPDFSVATAADVIYVCSPYNPTGTVATKEQLENLVQFAKENKQFIVFDSAYAQFITDPKLPRSIFEIEGADEVAIEIGSFSKWIGFTGVRCGWSVVPKNLKYASLEPVHPDWSRITSTLFNAASNIVQHGALASLSPQGLLESQQLIETYLGRAKKLRNLFKSLGFEFYGGENAPYVWVRIKEKKSWEAFHFILEQAHIVTVPGVGFGPAGEGFLRLSSFAAEEDIDEACKRLKKILKSGAIQG